MWAHLILIVFGVIVLLVLLWVIEMVLRRWGGRSELGLFDNLFKDSTEMS